MTKQSNFERFRQTYSYRKLIEEHSLDTVGEWKVFGEDPNPDWGGPHVEPFLGHFKGVLIDVINKAVELPEFWQWGAGGRIQAYRHVVKVVEAAEPNPKKKEILEIIKGWHETIDKLEKLLDGLEDKK